MHEGYAITAIEPDGGMIRQADRSLDARLLQGNAMSVECWREVGAGKMDYPIAVTATGENKTNIMSCVMAKHLMNMHNGRSPGMPRKCIALVNKEDYLVLAATMGSDIALNQKNIGRQRDPKIHSQGRAAFRGAVAWF